MSAGARASAVVLALLMLLQGVAIIELAGRAPHIDEAEYLHAAWLMDRGGELYVSFFEHHPPFLFAALRLVATDDVPLYLTRARVLSGAFGLLAVGALATILWRVRPEAAAIAVAFLFASNALWESALAEARPEPFALAFFWLGAALVLLARSDGLRSAIASGAGAACIAIAALWNPKWPLCSALVIAFWLAGTRRRIWSGAVALSITAVALLVMHLIAPLDRVWFFSVEYTRALWPWLSRSEETLRTLRGGIPFLLAPPLLGPIAMIAAVAVVGIALRRFEQQRIPLFFLLLAVAASLELRFTFPWPVIWRYYYLMWSCAAASLIGLVPAAVGQLVPRLRAAAPATAVVLLVVAVANIAATMPLGFERTPWIGERYMAARLKPAETVALDLTRHPIAVPDADYYWFGRRDVREVAKQLRLTARGRHYLPPVSYPFCAIPSRLRFVTSPRNLGAPSEEQRCFERLVREGVIRRTPFAGIYEISLREATVE